MASAPTFYSYKERQSHTCMCYIVSISDLRPCRLLLGRHGAAQWRYGLCLSVSMALGAIVLGVPVTVGVVLNHAGPYRDVLVFVNDAPSPADRLMGRSKPP